MRALIQRVNSASVKVDGKTIGEVSQGFLIFLGVGKADTEQEAEQLWEKIKKLRIFEDDQGKTNLSLSQVGGEVLVVSQFTLYANCRKGNRPSFTDGADPILANHLYEYFVDLVKASDIKVATGEFGAAMEVSLINDGPFTLWIDSEDLSRPR